MTRAKKRRRSGLGSSPEEHSESAGIALTGFARDLEEAGVALRAGRCPAAFRAIVNAERHSTRAWGELVNAYGSGMGVPSYDQDQQRELEDIAEELSDEFLKKCIR